MKQVAQNYKSGTLSLETVPEPALKPGGVLVRTSFSVISAGTEGMKVREGEMSLLGKAKARPDQVKKVIQSVQQQGLLATYQKVMNRLDSLTPLGYSLSGVVIGVGRGAEEFAVGQRVACGGAGYANHAEINFIPKNLVVPVPEKVAMPHAAFATIGAIAMQGYRQSGMQLGETACVIGLGLLGQLLVQMLKAGGIRVIGIDLSEPRCALALQHGAAAAFKADDPALAQGMAGATGGMGADCVFITAAGDTSQPIELAGEIARDRARVVDVGKIRVEIPWTHFYEKELELRFSRSYGPGRYDPTYEEGGVDYPPGYVRWTERRNMASFLDMVASGHVRLDSIIGEIVPFDEAERVYQDLAAGKLGGLGTVFRYAEAADTPAGPAVERKAVQKTAGQVRLGVVGAGNYASSMLLPHLQKNADVVLTEVATTRSLSAATAARKFGFRRSGTDAKAVLNGGDMDAVLIATRHASHAALAADALRAGKTVFVEKPLAIDAAGLELVRKAMAESGNDRLQVGFNRRFAPLVAEMKKAFSGRASPLAMMYRVHAGRAAEKSWYTDPAEGSRFVGEAGHFFDLFAFLAGSRPVRVFANVLRPAQPTADDLENMTVTVTYRDGSVGALLYLTQGGAKIPKELLEVFGGGKTARLNNFESLDLFEGVRQSRVRGRGIDKGQQQEMAAFVSAVKAGGPMPIPAEELIDTTLVTLAAVESLRTGQPVDLGSF